MKETIKNLHKVAKEFDKNIVDDLRNSITNIKFYYNLTNDDLAELLDLHVDYINNMLDGNADVDTDIDLRTMALLTLMSNGKLSVFNDSPSGAMYNAINCSIKAYTDDKYPQPKIEWTYQVSDSWYDKVKDILNMFGVTNDDDLDRLREAVSKVRGIIETYDESHPESKENKIPNEMCGVDKQGELYFDDKGNFSTHKPRILNGSTCHCKKDCAENSINANDNDTIKGVFYDSENMDKPKDFEFKINLAKDFPSLVKFFTDILK